ncbi:n-(beta-n-acetylglucosaminyl)-l [Plasmopara halstedii]|uniref:N-(Beta-n-acetylglucosaminyl)-l n=1 Tax=Plasmopara halstedii TaxID=4781 RepID=A0A0P1AJT2_PLAHL|nr:n-(beta-n-acetylglucosaminyl)-l [Plasmopara halstedii]CEG40840.1 n-(beta-n-acetylglucosaminyl)-l [Plasmopara halstedii]|eukprot:XP_024577209.1 n-(beta-n-acetylglucosaminyl)-l [Plasmopara halstedii]
MTEQSSQRWICGGFAVLVCFIMLLGSAHKLPQRGAVVINTWPFVNATRAGFQALQGRGGNSSALDAITRGCNRCEIDQCDFTVGYGGSPDSNGETTLDAMILDGTTMEMGAVAQLRRIKPAIKVARAVMEHSSHSILAGDGALAFAKMMGFEETTLDTQYSQALHQEWLKKKCQPNYFRNVQEQNTSCPPYRPLYVQDGVYAGFQDRSLLRYSNQNRVGTENLISTTNHDTIGMVVLAENGHMAAGTSSNGAIHKIAGRVGDASVPGAGAYVDSTIGGAAATGDGDVMMRFLPSFFAVQEMKKGTHPLEACRRALYHIAAVYPSFRGGMVCLNHFGEYGGAGFGWDFAYTVQASWMSEPHVVHVTPLSPPS